MKDFIRSMLICSLFEGSVKVQGCKCALPLEANVLKNNNNLLLVYNESEQEANIQQCSFSLSGLGLNCLTYSYV